MPLDDRVWIIYKISSLPSVNASGKVRQPLGVPVLSGCRCHSKTSPTIKMKCSLVLVVCAFVLVADAGHGQYRSGSHGGGHGYRGNGRRRHGYIESTAVCQEKGGECVMRNECKPQTNLVTGMCDAGDGICCVTRRYACEKWHMGICASAEVGCSEQDGYRTCGMACSEGVVCCVPENMGRGMRPNY
ncbi:hypothetical protein LSAT2_016676 [Lamellibrachia satsuma]|nr:hypothetical protein LSAT2_016676 [Lamellibrachia satsuma]